jgi:glycerophosphoryl diester phosphodiesterase
MRPVEIIAHRGMPREAPENTLAAFRRALDAGADGIELDVHGTADGVVVVHHDPTYRPTRDYYSDQRIRIAELAFAEIRMGPAANVEIPSLDEVLELVGDSAVVYVEIKAPNIEPAVVASIQGHGAACAVHSFDHRIAARVRGLASEIPTGVLLSSYLIEPATALRAAQARDLWQQREFVDPALIDACHAAGGRVIVWTVNDPDEARRFRDWGVDGICTDDSRSMREALG